MKNKRGFTLIELLAVIIILGILMIIAVPSVTRYINESRRNSYVYIVKGIIGGARNLANSGKFDFTDPNVTYYIDSMCINTENGLRSPYGEFSKSYVVLTYKNNEYAYYWTGVDDSGIGIKKITRLDKIDNDAIESNISESDIDNTVGLYSRKKYITIDKNNDCRKGEAQDVSKNIDGLTGITRKVDVDVTFDNPYPIIGDVAHFYARLTGYDGLNCTFQWQWSPDDVTYYNLEGETSQNMDIVITPENNTWWWKVLVYSNDN